jgi:hypothetical protein
MKMNMTVSSVTQQYELSLAEIADISQDVKAKYGPPLKAVRASRVTMSLFPVADGPVRLGAVPVVIDDSLSLGEFKEVYEGEDERGHA